MTETNKQTTPDIIEINGVKYQSVDKPKPETLYGVCMDWWDEVHTNELRVTVSDLVDRIKDWLPDSIVDECGLSEWDEAWNSGYNYYRKTLMEKLGND